MNLAIDENEMYWKVSLEFGGFYQRYDEHAKDQYDRLGALAQTMRLALEKLEERMVRLASEMQGRNYVSGRLADAVGENGCKVVTTAGAVQ